ncbi:unnamed protein product [Colias eurytheme]|nr:unnamed protein product [Colias eurytheme]
MCSIIWRSHIAVNASYGLVNGTVGPQLISENGSFLNSGGICRFLKPSPPKIGFVVRLGDGFEVGAWFGLGLGTRLGLQAGGRLKWPLKAYVRICRWHLSLFLRRKKSSSLPV